MLVKPLKSLLEENPKVLIINHQNPDGDAMGSALALARVLNNHGIENHVLVPNAYPDYLHWMTGNDKVVIGENNPEQAEKLFNEAELIFALDFNAQNRCGMLEPHLRKSKAKKVMIDHHREPEDFADFTFSNPAKSSAAQMVFEFVREIDWLEYMDKEASECIYTGLVTDTGSFRFSSTGKNTHMIAADLISRGIEPHLIHQKLFDNGSINRLRLLGNVLEHIEILKKDKTAVLTLPRDMQVKYNYSKGDSEGFVNYGLSIKNINVAAFFRDEGSEIRISFRSHNAWDVNTFARTYFNGGGHLNAAGGKFEGSLKEAVDHFKKNIKNLTELKPE